jgi:hypothetical protein
VRTTCDAGPAPTRYPSPASIFGPNVVDRSRSCRRRGRAPCHFSTWPVTLMQNRWIRSRSPGWQRCLVQPLGGDDQDHPECRTDLDDELGVQPSCLPCSVWESSLCACWSRGLTANTGRRKSACQVWLPLAASRPSGPKATGVAIAASQSPVGTPMPSQRSKSWPSSATRAVPLPRAQWAPELAAALQGETPASSPAPARHARPRRLLFSSPHEITCEVRKIP